MRGSSSRRVRPASATPAPETAADGRYKPWSRPPRAATPVQQAHQLRDHARTFPPAFLQNELRFLAVPASKVYGPTLDAKPRGRRDTFQACRAAVASLFQLAKVRGKKDGHD